jgi:hypothetical protein
MEASLLCLLKASSCSLFSPHPGTYILISFNDHYVTQPYTHLSLPAELKRIQSI